MEFYWQFFLPLSKARGWEYMGWRVITYFRCHLDGACWKSCWYNFSSSCHELCINVWIRHSAEEPFEFVPLQKQRSVWTAEPHLYKNAFTSGMRLQVVLDVSVKGQSDVLIFSFSNPVMLQSQTEIINHLVDKEAFEYLFPVMGWSDIVGMRLDIKRTEVVVTSVALPKKKQ